MDQLSDIQSFVELGRKAKLLPELRLLLEDVTQAFGFRYFALGHHVNVLSGSLVHLSNYPLDFANDVRTTRHFTQDPVVLACQTTTAGFRWSELPALIHLSQEQLEILVSANRVGIGEGYTIPANIPGECVGSCSFAVETGHLMDERVLPAIQYIGCFAFEAARRLGNEASQAGRLQHKMPLLTRRQLDCVVLIAQGKSDSVVGQLLGINERTVHEHVEAAKGKYHVSSRVQLVIRALFDNQLGFTDIIQH